ncbi:MAG: hypothetical protein CM15mP6_2250 [Methanobacteriota archaeon]|nr:MAG: hypothetical protein CM15mP6_2250 [Euryarchaeota archaeon]
MCVHAARRQRKILPAPRWARRLILATFLFLDANLMGTLNGFGSLNLLDRILGGGLPNDMVWILQVVQSISAGFIVVKILFDDAPEGLLEQSA